MQDDNAGCTSAQQAGCLHSRWQHMDHHFDVAFGTELSDAFVDVKVLPASAMVY